MPLSGNGVLPKASPPFAAFLDRVNSDPASDEYAFCARNAFLDERVTSARANDYVAVGAADDHADLPQWVDTHNNDYLPRHVALPKRVGELPPSHPSKPRVDCPDTFDPAHGNLSSLAGDRRLVRLVRFPRVSRAPLTTTLTDFRAAAECVAAGGATAADRRTIARGLSEWDSIRADLIPQWVARWSNVADLFGAAPDDDSPNWEDLLRDRLGLYDWRGHPTPIPVLLLRYYAREIPSRGTGGRERLLAVPSMLDGGLYPAFCPAPAREASGYNVDLSPPPAALQNNEYVHAAIRHTPDHVFRVGTITTAAGELAAARDRHLKQVRAWSGRSDYGVGTDP